MKRPFAFICLTFFLLSSCAGAGHYNPPSGAGRIVLMISGKSGPSLYVEHARRLSASGYTVLLHDGNDFPLDRPHACRAMIQEILREAQLSRGAPKGRAAVIGYSLGGAVALACASSMEEEIAGLVVYDPATGTTMDHGAITITNVASLRAALRSGTPFGKAPFSGVRELADGTLAPRSAQGIALSGDGTVYVMTLSPLCVLRIDSLRAAPSPP